MSLILITAPAAEPVTTAEVKDAGRVDGTALDAQIAILIASFRRKAEHILGRRLITQTVELVLDDFPIEHIDLIMPGAQSITSIKYLDTSGTDQTLSAGVYALDADSTPNRALLKYDQQWPDTQDVPNAVRVRYVVGYGASSSSVPQNIRLWIIAQVCAALDNQSPPAWLDRLLDADMVHRV